ncbi:MAG: CHAT domain-containing protein, partial [Chloroflexia bacterium]
MADVRYQNFDLTVQKEGKGYKIRVDSLAGEASGRFSVPFSDLELENFYLNTTPGKRSVRRIDTPEVAVAKKYGERLFKAVFTEEVLGRLQSALSEADRNDERLRIRLRLTDVPELIDLPWDYLYNPALNRFLALGNDTALVRYLELPERVRPVTVQLPLKMLVVISSPNDFPQLDVSQEWVNMNEALSDLVGQGLVRVELMEDATMPELRRRLSKEQYNILHFIGHGAFDRQTEEGVLVFKDENGRGRLVSGQQLGVLTHNHKSLALAVINACEGAKGDRSDVFAGTAQSLVQQGIPAVVAMQREITDDAAKVFAHAFYSAVAAGNPVEAAMTETRIALYAEQLGLEWATPVLYMRAQDGRVFDLQASVARPVQAAKPVEPPAPVTRRADVASVVEQSKSEEAAVIAPAVPGVTPPAATGKQETPAVPAIPLDSGKFAKKVTSTTDEIVRSMTQDMTQQHGAAAADYAAVALEKAKRETLAENKKNNPRMNNMALVALGLIGVVAAIVLIVSLANGNGGKGEGNNSATNPGATTTTAGALGVTDLMATQTAVTGQSGVATPGVFEKLEEKAFATPLPSGSEADSIVFSEDEAFLAVWFFVGTTSEGSNKGKILIWSLDSDEPIREFDVKGYDRGYAQMAFFPTEGDSMANRK